MSEHVLLGIDRIKCDGHGVCADLVPELIELDDWGYPIIRGGEIPQPVLPHAKRAVAGCPALALRLQAVAARR
jgi:ferredoxin